MIISRVLVTALVDLLGIFGLNNGVYLTVYPWYLLCSLGILGDNLPINTHYIYIYRPYIGISHRGTLVGVHPTMP